tara:strand:- start:244 stop:858 length:615 start_codon:yes stop_codon:yes gene_type:complete
MMNVAQVFPRLIGIVNFQQNMDDINNQLEQVKSSNKDFGTRSEDSYVLDQLPFLNFKQQLVEHANAYFENVLCYKPSDLRMTQSWVNVKSPGEHHWPHKHPNSVISGTYYWQDDIVPLVFTDDKESNFHIEHDQDKLQEFDMAQKIINCYVQKNTLVLFESNLMHGVGPNNGNENRYSLAFNMFPTKLGNKEALSELNITQLTK